jgi:hypothetical protein
LVHEYAHLAGAFKDHFFGPFMCQAAGAHNPTAALANADNYRMYFMVP